MQSDTWVSVIEFEVLIIQKGDWCQSILQRKEPLLFL